MADHAFSTNSGSNSYITIKSLFFIDKVSSGSYPFTYGSVLYNETARYKKALAMIKIRFGEKLYGL